MYRRMICTRERWVHAYLGSLANLELKKAMGGGGENVYAYAVMPWM